MRVGWHVPLPGPFYAGGMVWRSRGHGGCLTLIIVLGIAAAVIATHGWALVAVGVLMVIGAVATVARERKARQADPEDAGETP